MDVPIHDADAPPACVVARPDCQTAPLVFVSAHSGTYYPDAFLRGSRLDAQNLRRSEDMFVDDLFACAASSGAPLLRATFPRAFCDPNREKWELDPAMFDGALPEFCNTSSLRVGAGLGTIARVVASGEAIYRDKLRFADAALRMEQCWQPFHDALSGLLAETRRRFGACLLLDCHSMPTQGLLHGPARRMPADVVLGDAHGTACAPAVMRAVEQAFVDAGFAVRRNDPYAGGYITRHYGRPSDGVHAVQIELARALYMDEVRLARLDAFADLQRRLASVVAALARDADSVLDCENRLQEQKNGGTLRRRQV